MHVTDLRVDSTYGRVGYCAGTGEAAVSQTAADVNRETHSWHLFEQRVVRRTFMAIAKCFCFARSHLAITAIIGRTCRAIPQSKSHKNQLNTEIQKQHTLKTRQRLWLRLGVNIDDQLWLRLNPIPIPTCNPSANPSPSRNTNTNPNPNPNPNRPTTPLLTLTDPLTSK